MKFLTLTTFVVCAFFALAEDDGKYRPEATTAAAIPVVTTVRPVPRWNNPAWNNPAWNNPAWNNPAWNDPRFGHRYNNTWGGWGRPYDTKHNPYRPDWRTIRLDEKADARGYTYVYETVGGILAEESGTFENIGLRYEGVRVVGSIQISDPSGVVYKINYQADSKEPYVPRGSREAERIPPTIARVLALLESHK